MSLGTAMCCCPVVHTSWNPTSGCRNSMLILCLGCGITSLDLMGGVRVSWYSRLVLHLLRICMHFGRKQVRRVEGEGVFKTGEVGCPPCSQVFANYSWLSSGPPIYIAATELRGITIEQLSSLQLGRQRQMPRQFAFVVPALVAQESEQSEDIMSHHITSHDITSSQTQTGHRGWSL